MSRYSCIAGRQCDANIHFLPEQSKSQQSQVFVQSNSSLFWMFFVFVRSQKSTVFKVPMLRVWKRKFANISVAVKMTQAKISVKDWWTWMCSLRKINVNVWTRPTIIRWCTVLQVLAAFCSRIVMSNWLCRCHSTRRWKSIRWNSKHPKNLDRKHWKYSSISLVRLTLIWPSHLPPFRIWCWIRKIWLAHRWICVTWNSRMCKIFRFSSKTIRVVAMSRNWITLDSLDRRLQRRKWMISSESLAKRGKVIDIGAECSDQSTSQTEQNLQSRNKIKLNKIQFASQSPC